jgi:ribosome-binding factor A
LQLCRQIERALSVALEGELLRDLTVQSIIPAPDSTRLLATFAYHGPASIPTDAILDALKKQHPHLRAAIAAAIHRKKTPELTYHVVR